MWRIVLVAVLVAGPAAAQTPTPTRPKGKTVSISAPRPRYPVDAQGRHPTGHGIVLVQVDQKTGRVTSARMEKSTGNALLDDAALDAFRRWKFRPGRTAAEVHIPINFTKGANVR